MSPLHLILSALTTTSPTTITQKVPLTTNEALSGILGSVSLACWLFLLLPQLIENYRNSSAEAISLLFIFVWFIGDLCNLFGALWAGLVPVIVAIAIYFCIADGVLIGQCLYYGIRNKRREGRKLLAEEARRLSSAFGQPERIEAGVGGPRPARRSNSSAVVEDEDNETQPLLERTHTGSITIPGSAHRRSSAASRRRASSGTGQNDHLAKILEESDATGTRLWFKNLMSILAILAVGAIGWAIAYESGVWKPSPPETGHNPNRGEEPAITPGAQVLGYASAICYLGARIPQIIKNSREKSCEGLSLLFFILSLLGNVTYGAGILFHSTERTYFMKNLPWLIGSFGTMAEDVTIFVQFHLYRKDKAEENSESAVI